MRNFTRGDYSVSERGGMHLDVYICIRRDSNVLLKAT